MRSTNRALVLCVVAPVVLLANAAHAATAPKRITGTLTKAGYTVLAVAADGTARSVRARYGRFALRPPGRSVTLQLRSPDGTYAGPVVARRAKRKVIVGVRAGARLGRIMVRRGYAKPVRRPRAGWVDTTSWARARNGVPIGNGRNFGLVRSKRPRRAPPGDRDADGVPDRLDVDANGNRVLDNLERKHKARAARTNPPGFFIHAGLLAGAINLTVNANAAAVTPEQVDANLASHGSLKLSFPNVPAGASAELDCGAAVQQPAQLQGLVYCSRGGTGTIAFASNPSAFQAFPDCCLDPATGLGRLQGTHAPDTMLLHHGATTAQIGTGDVLIERIIKGKVTTDIPATVQFVFATNPALARYDDGQGNSVSIAYPVICGVNNPCDNKFGFPVAAGPGGDVVVKLTFWRPQRARTPGDPGAGQWMDIGYLIYSARWGDQSNWPSCPANAYSDFGLDLAPGPGAGFLGFPGFADLAADRPADPANTISYTLNLSRCLAANGGSFAPGDTRYFVFSVGTDKGDETTQSVWFTRQP